MGATHFGPYRLDAILSRSTAATVYRARDTSHHDRIVALKVFDDPVAQPVTGGNDNFVTGEPVVTTDATGEVALLGSPRWEWRT